MTTVRAAPAVSAPAVSATAVSATAAARRQLLVVVSAASSVLALSTLLDRTELRRVGRWSSVASWTTTNQTLVGLRLLRVLAFVGSAGVLAWLATLALLCIPARTRRIVGGLRVPGATLIRGALVGSIAIAAIGLTGPSAMAERRSITSTHDATGGQRWPELTPPSAVVVRPATTVVVAPTTVSTLLASPPLRVDPSVVPVVMSAPPVTVAPLTTAGPALPMVVAFRTAAVHAATASAFGRRVVIAGESFWSIAETHVLQNMDEASDEDVADYWRVLIDVNRARLPDPDNPDLLWVGIELVLPPLPGSAAPTPS